MKQISERAPSRAARRQAARLGRRGATNDAPAPSASAPPGGLILSGWPLGFAGLGIFALGLIVGSALQSIAGVTPVTQPTPVSASVQAGQAQPVWPAGTGAAETLASGATPGDVDDPNTRLLIDSMTDYRALVDLGNREEDQHHGKMAILAYEKALTIQPGDPNVVTDLGIAYRMAGQPQEAVKRFRQAATLDPSHTMCWYNLGIVLRDDLSDPQGALEAWQHLLKMNPSPDLADKARQMLRETSLGRVAPKP